MKVSVAAKARGGTAGIPTIAFDCKLFQERLTESMSPKALTRLHVHSIMVRIRRRLLIIILGIYS